MQHIFTTSTVSSVCLYLLAGRLPVVSEVRSRAFCV